MADGHGWNSVGRSTRKKLNIDMDNAQRKDRCNFPEGFPIMACPNCFVDLLQSHPVPSKYRVVALYIYILYYTYIYTYICRFAKMSVPGFVDNS